MTTRRRLLTGGLVPLVRPLRSASISMAGYGLEVIPREEWADDRPQLGSPGVEEVRFLLVHHSASSSSYGEGDIPAILRGFYDLHTGPDKSWFDIAYNFLIDRFGRVWEGRDGSVEGPVIADATGGNQGFAQLACLIGDFTTEMPTQEALASLTRVLSWMADRYRIDTAPGATVKFDSRGSNRWDAGVEVETPTIAGHRDMSTTACPGDAFYPYVVDGLGAEVEALRQQLRSPETTTTSTTMQPATTAPPVDTAAPPATTAVATTTSSPLALEPSERRSSSPWFRGMMATGLVGLLAVLLRRLSNAESPPSDPDDL